MGDQRKARFALALTLSIALFLGLTAAGDAKSKVETFAGELRFIEGASIEVVVRPHARPRPTVRFKAKKVLFECEDGTKHRLSFPRMQSRLRGDGSFQMIEDQVSVEFGNQNLYWVEGRLVGRNRAKGFLYALRDSATPDVTDCSTFGRLSWDARRHR